MLNEFHTINGTCTTLVPSGPGYENATFANQACAAIGSQPSMAIVPGDVYTRVTYGYMHSHLWRVRDYRCGPACAMNMAVWYLAELGNSVGFWLWLTRGPTLLHSIQ